MSTAIQIVILVLMFIWIVRFVRKGRTQSAQDVEVTKNRIGDGMRELAAKKKKYAVMTTALLFETPDDVLVEAILCNLWAKMKPDLSNAFAVMQTVNMHRQYLFTLYAITGGIRQAGMQKLKDSSDAKLLPQCVDALEAIGIGGCADILREAMQAEDSEAYTEPYLEHFYAEDGVAKMVAFIRANAADFCDL